MPWALDGYNVMFAARIEGVDADFEKHREEFIARLKRVKDTVTVFFDASKAPPGSTAPPESRGRLEIIYVREGSADDAMVNWLKRQQRPQEVKVVTNDRELAARLKTLHAKTARVDEFLKLVDPERLEGKEKPNISLDEAKQWAKEFGFNPDDKV